MRVLVAVLILCWTAPVAAQDTGAQPSKFRLGLFGFAAQAGIDFSGDDQAVFGATLDVGNLYGERLRMRAGAELGIGSAANTYVFNGEILFRFLPDAMVAVPYVGGGLALYTQEQCDSVARCPAVWLQFALGFELRIRDYIAWFMEYHGEDAFRRNRLFIGLTTRRGR
jgi:hypothetical protein